MQESLYRKYLECNGVTTDSRKINRGDLFFALRGPNFNGNQFAVQALEKGASWAVIDDEKFNTGSRMILVDNSLKTLQELGNFHRKQFLIPVIAITGSNGKTTTKELINLILSEKYHTIATQGNLNNHIGVPLTLLSIHPNTEIAVIEMGANKPGDIRELCDIADPDHGIITNIGKAHIEGFGSMDGVLRTKTELFDHLLKRGGKVFINTSNPILNNLKKRFPDPVLFPGRNDYYHCEFLSADPYVSFRAENGETVNTKLIGEYNFYNIAAALCIGKFFGVAAKLAHKAVSEYVPSNMRSQVIRKGSNIIIMDAYNANPSSMEAALDTLKRISATHKLAILGDMLELGNISQEEHARIGKLTAAISLDETLFCGPEMAAAHKTYKESHYFENKNLLENYLAGKHFENTAILIKASRGMQLETVINHIN